MQEQVPGHRRSLPVYIGAGGIATGAHYAVTIASVELLAVNPVIASAMGFSVGAAIKYWLNYSVAFRSSAKHTHAMVRFAVMLGIFMALNTLVFAFFQRGLGLHYILAQVLTTGVLIPPGYLMSRQWVFR